MAREEEPMTASGYAALPRPTTHGTRSLAPSDARRYPDPAQDRARLLLVEPDAAIADLVATILTDEGYAVDHAPTPDVARARIGGCGSVAYDLVLSVPYADPFRAPYAWLDRLRSWARVPVVICARHPAALYADHRRRGYAAYLEEPFEGMRQNSESRWSGAQSSGYPSPL